MANEMIQTDRTLLAKQMEEGQVTAAGAATITDATKTWTVNQWAGYGYKIVAGLGAGSSGRIISNTATVLTLVAGIATDVDSKYIIFQAILTDADGNPQVDVLTLPSLPAGANNIGDVDVLTQPIAAAPAAAVPAVVAVIGGSDVVGGAVRTMSVDAAGNPQVDVLTLPSLPAGANNIGDVDIASALPAGANNIGDVDVLTQPIAAAPAAAIPAVVAVIGGSDGGTTRAVLVDAAGHPQVDVLSSVLPSGAATEASLALVAVTGKQINIGGTLRTVTRVAFDVSATTTSVVAAVANQKIYVVGLEFSCNTDAMTFKLTENTVGDLHADQTFMKGGGKVVGSEHKAVQYETSTVNKALDITTVGGKATGSLWYCQF